MTIGVHDSKMERHKCDVGYATFYDKVKTSMFYPDCTHGPVCGARQTLVSRYTLPFCQCCKSQICDWRQPAEVIEID